MRRTHRLAGILVSLVLIVGLFFWLRSGGSGEDVLVQGGPEGTAAGTVTTSAARAGPAAVPGAGGTALFRFGNPYLDGRSAWLGERFREARESLRDLAAPAEAVIQCKVHRAPFTTGPWVETLDDELARHRAETESQTVESRVVLFVPGVEPDRVMLYFAAAEYMERIPGEGRMEQDTYLAAGSSGPAGAGLAGLEGLGTPPDLGPGRWLSRQRWSRPLAMPTATYYVHAAFRDGPSWGIVYEAWRNFGGSDHAAIRLASGQYAAVARDGGSLVILTSFYSGQKIPPLMDGLVVGMTTEFYRKLVRLVSDEARAWKPDAAAAAWLEQLGMG